MSVEVHYLVLIQRPLCILLNLQVIKGLFVLLVVIFSYAILLPQVLPQLTFLLDDGEGVLYQTGRILAC